MPPEWDADSPELRDHIVRVLESIERHAVKREPPTLDDARRWQSGLMRGLEVGDPQYVGAYRGEAGLEHVQVHVDWVFGVAAPEVGVALVDWEATVPVFQQLLEDFGSGPA